MDEIGPGVRLKAAARTFHFACFPFFYEPAVEYGRVRALSPHDAVARDIELSANESSSCEQWSAYGLQTIALLNEAVVESGESLEGNYAYFDRQRVTQFLSPDPRRRLKRNVLREAVRGCRAALEIGFNAGHSAAIILDANSRVHLTAIDLGVHRYAPACAAVMAGRYPGRFAVHWGASRAIFRQLDERRAMDFDFIHIDGGHSPRATVTDIAFALRSARPGSTIAIDDAYTPYISKLLHWAVAAGYFDVRETAAPPSGENRVFVRTNRPFLLARWIDLGLLVGPPEVRMRSGLRAMVLAGQNARGRSAEL